MWETAGKRMCHVVPRPQAQQGRRQGQLTLISKPKRRPPWRPRRSRPVLRLLTAADVPARAPGMRRGCFWMLLGVPGMHLKCSWMLYAPHNHNPTDI